MPARKWLIWIEEDGTDCPRRKSPKSASACEILPELYKLKPLLSAPNLRLCIVMLELEEYRLKNGWGNEGKRGDVYKRQVYERTVEIDLSTLKPTVSMPHLPENTKTIGEVSDVRIDQSVIGSCTNGRMEDMRMAASILKGRKIAKGVRCIVIPATQEIYLNCVREGLTEIFIEAGAVFSTPT